MLKSEKVSKDFVQNRLKIFFLVFTSLNIPWNPKNDKFLEEKSKIIHKSCPTATGKEFSPKFILDANV